MLGRWSCLHRISAPGSGALFQLDGPMRSRPYLTACRGQAPISVGGPARASVVIVKLADDLLGFGGGPSGELMLPCDRIVGVQGPCHAALACATPRICRVNLNHGRSLHPRVLTDPPVPEAACPPRPRTPGSSRFLCLNACIVKSARTVALCLPTF